MTDEEVRGAMCGPAFWGCIDSLHNKLVVIDAALASPYLTQKERFDMIREQVQSAQAALRVIEQITPRASSVVADFPVGVE